MSRQDLELAHVVRAYAADFARSRPGAVPASHRHVLHQIAACRTAELGGHVEQCDGCGHEVIAYNSCRNRHCPKCQALARFHWLEQRRQDLLPVEYFHVVFTIPQEIASIALQNKKIVYDILFQTAAQSLQTLAADSKHLGAEIGALCVLHTWGQNLLHHPHIHCVVPGGGISKDGSRWISCRRGFFLPVRVLGRLFRGKFVDRLRCAYDQGRLQLHGDIARLNDPAIFRRFVRAVYDRNWVVYAKPPFGGPEQVLKYLARYTHRVAIANSRLVSMQDGRVSFTWKDYASGCQRRVMTIDAIEFLRRFLLHVLPKGYVRIRTYGFLSNRRRRASIKLCRKLLGDDAEMDNDARGDSTSEPAEERCPMCHSGVMRIVCDFKPGSMPPQLSVVTPKAIDSS